MGKKLIITEKPSVAREFAAVLHVNGRQDGYIENEDYVISWCVGHLVGMVYPEDYDIKYKEWKLEDLPFLPKEYKYNVIKNVSKQYDIVHGLLQREDVDTVYWAGDAGKEGQTIEENIRNFGGVREGMEELRVWIDSQTEEEILRGIKEARPMSDYANLGLSGIMRTIEDYAMGINFSRAMSVKYGKLLNDAAATKKYSAIAVGRVMTCVLGMVVIREREIRNFSGTPFYRVLGSFSDAGILGEWKAVEGSRYFESPLLYKENGFKEQENAQKLIDDLTGKPAVVDSIERFVSKKKAPLLFNLAELQAECTKRFKISPDETLTVAQSLYEKKLTTYPRTDARVLSTAIAGEIGKNINRLKGYEPTAKYCENIMANRLAANIANTQYTDDSKITDHYAIIPTGQLTELKSLNELEAKVFDMIVRRFLSIFYPPAEFDNVKLVVKVDGESFFSSAKKLAKPGYMEIAGIPKKKSNVRDGNERIMGAYSEGEKDSEGEGEEEQEQDPEALLKIADTLQKGAEISTKGYSIGFGKTSPPKRYTSGSMVLAMENAGQLIEDEELRAQIKGSGIGTSATRAEIIKKLVDIGYLHQNKAQILTPERFGEMVYEVVEMTVPALLNPKMTASWEKGLDGITNGTVDYWDYRNKLEEFIRNETQRMIGQDIHTELADRISHFAGRDGRGAGARRKVGVKCPMCGGELVTTSFGFGCTNYKSDKSGCNFNVGEIAGVILSDEQLKDLIEKGRTEVISGFKSKKGNKFDAALKFALTADDNPFEEGENQQSTEKNDRGYRIDFEFAESEPEPIEGLKCPWCGGQMCKTHFGYRCENYKADDESSCRFSVGEIAGKAIPLETFKTLLTEKKTDTIRGFKSKSGKKFDACLVLKADESGKEQIVFDFENVEEQIVDGVVCPWCGGAIKKTAFGFGCTNYNRNDENSCKFAIGKIAGKKLSESDVFTLLTQKRTQTLRGFKGKSGKKFDACLELKPDESGKEQIVFDFEHVEDKVVEEVKCPVCGGKIIVTSYGFRCENYSKEEGGCIFSIGELCQKSINEKQVKQLLTEGRTETIRGFKSKAGKKFDARITLAKNEEDKVTGLKFDFDDVEPKTVKDVVCPKCKGAIAVTNWGYACVNRKRNPEESTCDFAVGEIASVKLKEDQLKELLIRKKTAPIDGFVAKTGMKFSAALKLTEEGEVKFDFPEKPKPVESDVVCPKCQKKMMRGQWQYECECGFKFWHTVGKIPLAESVIMQLLKNHKTEKKVVGFTSKAGNEFDACLKWENDQISYDFENEGNGYMDGNGNEVKRDVKAETTPFGPVEQNDMDEISKMIEEMHQEEEGKEA